MLGRIRGRARRLLKESVLRRWCTYKAKQRLRRPRAGGSHPLPSDLIVSLTSYPARFGTLHLTLGCLLDQTIRADRAILWIAHDDIDRLPAAVLELEERGLEIRICDDLRSYKKLIPAIEAFPHAYVATADDDIYYRRDWLEKLVDGAEESVIACHRAHRMRWTADGTLRPYLEWQFDVQDAKARKPSADILPTGGAGALYPPRGLDQRVTDRSLSAHICPDGDDLWFYWCARIAGMRHKKVGRKMWLVTWAGSQTSTLWSDNEAGGNDRMIAALEREFGQLNSFG